ncbi:YqcI/YcgG family protein [Nocardia sp. BMG51109]|uniref:YqcI/YcgG family protein n=1 Tax=Nocardia sp. BMG51109 TaxID=1056816 RepID=UPI000467B79D|nr:YqcI/YcgG family protein [Nocardia sp. BMG51109]
MLSDETLSTQVIGWLPSWGPDVIGDLTATLTGREDPFPCTFAVSAVRKSSLRFGFVGDVDDARTWSALPGILTEYLRGYRRIDRETSLVVFFGPQRPVADLGAYRRRFWDVLRFLHDRDTAPWPGEIPRDTENPAWEFSFGGTPLFVVCNTPAHLARRSRYSPVFMISFQPRWVFEEIGADTPRGATARRVIRQRLRAFDNLEPASALGGYGDPGNREWRQYFLSDAVDDAEPVCPFRHRDSR